MMMRRGILEMRERKCDIAGTRKNSKAMSVSKSNRHTHRTQEVNLQERKLWWEEGNKFVRIRISTRTLKTIKLRGLDATAKKFGINLNKFSVSYGSKKPAETTANV
jgi:large subunit ribosomal protein L28